MAGALWAFGSSRVSFIWAKYASAGPPARQLAISSRTGSGSAWLGSCVHEQIERHCPGSESFSIPNAGTTPAVDVCDFIATLPCHFAIARD